MSELHDDPTLLQRTFRAELTPGEGRTADVRIVPYNTPATVADPWFNRGEPYQEEWAPGVFSHQLGAAHRVTANIEHEQGVAGLVAKGTALRDGGDALYGSFKFLATPNGDTALELVREGTFDSVSLEARPVKAVRTKSGAIRRVKANLMGIAFCRNPAFADAQVLAVREGEEGGEIVVDESLLLPTMSPDLLARAAALGIKLPEGMAAEAEALLVRAFSNEPWDGSSSNYKDAAAYCEACIIDDNPAGKPKVAEKCHLPVKEPDGDYNVHAIRDALSRLDQVQTTSSKDAARKRLQALLAQADKKN